MTEIRKPFWPPSQTERAENWRQSYVRAVTARVLGQLHKSGDEEILRTAWPDDHAAGVMLQQRAAVAPTKVADYPGGSVTQIMELATDSALAEIIALAVKVDPKGLAQLRMAVPTNVSEAYFIEEGTAIPAASGTFTSVLIDGLKKLALIAPITGDLGNYSAPAASVVISNLIKVLVGNGGTKVLLSADAPTDAAPAGIRYNIPALVAGASPGDDIKALIAEIAANGISTRSIVFIAASDVVASLETQAWPLFKRKVIEANVLDPGTLIALAADALVVAGGDSPTVDLSRHGTFHLADPAEQISTPGTPASIAAPAISMFQSDSYSLRCICRINWAVAEGAVAWMNVAVTP